MPAFFGERIDEAHWPRAVRRFRILDGRPGLFHGYLIFSRCQLGDVIHADSGIFHAPMMSNGQG